MRTLILVLVLQCSTGLATFNFSENELIAKFARVFTSLKLPGIQYQANTYLMLSGSLSLLLLQIFPFHPPWRYIVLREAEEIGVSCCSFSDVDECKMLGTCPTTSTCVNLPGTFNCTCPSGYVHNRVTNKCDGELVASPEILRRWGGGGVACFKTN